MRISLDAKSETTAYCDQVLTKPHGVQPNHRSFIP
jgi:hypothetical protein